MARYRRFGEQSLVFRKVFIGPPVFKTNLDNDSDIDQSGCTALPTCRRHVVNGTHCVGVSVLTNRLRKTHSRGGHWINPVDYLPFLTSALRWHHWSDEAATCASSTEPSFTRPDPPCPHPLLLLQRCVDKKKMMRVEFLVCSTARGARMATPAL